jgi:nucleoid-associated protein YgaU
MMADPAAPSFDHLLLGLAHWVLAGCVVWGCLILVAAIVEASTHGRVLATTWVATPPAVRRLLLAGLGVALVGGVPGPVSAAMTGGAIPRPAPLPTTRPALAVPARPLGGPADHAVVVRPGDTLWRLAAAALPATASDAEIVTATHRWYARNRRVIGPDPDLIRPRQHLRPPARSHEIQESHR